MSSERNRNSMEAAELEVERQKCRVRASAERPRSQDADDRRGLAGSALRLAMDHPIATASILFGVVAVVGPIRLARLVMLGARTGSAIATVISVRDSH